MSEGTTGRGGSGAFPGLQADSNVFECTTEEAEPSSGGEDRSAPEPVAFGALVAVSPPMVHAIELGRRAATGNMVVTLLGASGSGKTLLARAIAAATGRSGRTVELNTASVPKGLLESTLFGRRRGGFTGATDSPGVFEQADGGVLLLDEIGDMPLEQQTALLKVLEDGVVRPVGASTEVAVDVFVIVATHRDLWAEVDAGRFRRDLFWRLQQRVIELPGHGCAASADMAAAVSRLPPALSAVAAAMTPMSPGRSCSGGSARQLAHVVRLAAEDTSGRYIDADDLVLPDVTPAEKAPEEPLAAIARTLRELCACVRAGGAAPARAAHPDPARGTPQASPADPAEEPPRAPPSRDEVVSALEAARFCQRDAAEALGLRPRTLCDRLLAWGLRERVQAARALVRRGCAVAAGWVDGDPECGPGEEPVVGASAGELRALLEAHGGNQSAAARALGMPQSTFWNRIERLGVRAWWRARGSEEPDTADRQAGTRSSAPVDAEAAAKPPPPVDVPARTEVFEALRRQVTAVVAELEALVLEVQGQLREVLLL